MVTLDVLRGLAAMGVVLFHYTAEYGRRFGIPGDILHFEAGALGVDLFFIISGFVIFLSLDKTRCWLDFVVSRFSRLFPAYWSAVLLTFAVVASFGLPGRTVTAGDAFINLSMLEQFFFIPFVDGVYWTLSLELCFYAIMLLLYRADLLRGRRIDVVCGIWLAYIAVIHMAGIQLPERVQILSISQYGHLFIAGMMLYKLWNAGRDWLRIALVGGCLAVEGYFYGSLAGGLALVFSFAVIAGVTGHLSWLDRRPLVFLGTISYSLYLIHQNIGYVILRAEYAAGISPWPATLVAVAVSIMIATVITWLVEKPAMAVIRGWYRQREKVS